ncbi:MAG: hypothetical protein II813_09675 [Spirochaetales bacterium]|nr:hypothetical protein [Spirochaetales bacterium]
MSKKNKVIKLASKNRDRGKSYYVTYNGVEMTRAEREALIRAAQAKSAPEPAPSGKKAKKGTKIAEPSHSKLFSLLRPKKKQTVAPDLKSVENTEPVVKKKEEPAPEPKPAKKAEPVVEKKPEPAPEPVKEPEPVVEPVVEEVAPAPEPEPVVEEAAPAAEPVAEEAAPAEEPAPKKVAADDDDDDEEEDDDDEEDDLSEAINKKNAKKRISPNFVKRVGKTAGQGADECINIQHTFDEKIAEIDAQIKAAKTPKDADDAVKAEYNEKRKALRKEKKQLELERDTNANKAEAFERACDGYCDIYTLLTGKELDVRKTERLNPFVPLTEEMELEVLNSLWADKNARRAPKKKK